MNVSKRVLYGVFTVPLALGIAACGNSDQDNTEEIEEENEAEIQDVEPGEGNESSDEEDESDDDLVIGDEEDAEFGDDALEDEEEEENDDDDDDEDITFDDVDDGDDINVQIIEDGDIYEEADSDSDVIGSVEEGGYFQGTVQDDGEWVEIDRSPGFVNADLLEIEDDDA